MFLKNYTMTILTEINMQNLISTYEYHICTWFILSIHNYTIMIEVNTKL